MFLYKLWVWEGFYKHMAESSTWLVASLCFNFDGWEKKTQLAIDFEEVIVQKNFFLYC